MMNLEYALKIINTILFLSSKHNWEGPCDASKTKDNPHFDI